MLMNKEQVKSFLPHREPFLFVDSLEKIEPQVENPQAARDLVGTKIITKYFVREDHPIFEGHFPDKPILPGVIQVEMMAQSAAFCAFGILSVDNIHEYDVDTMLLAVEKAKFRKPIFPGMQLEVRASLDRCRGPMAYYSGEIFCEDEKLSEITVLARLVIKKKE